MNDYMEAAEKIEEQRKIMSKEDLESILDLKDQMSFYPPVGFDAK